jgi:hypothetical protein
MSTQRKITTLKVRIEIKDHQRGLCKICQQPLGFRYHVDHIRALCFGGRNELDNLQALCFVCHDNKSFLELMLFHQQKYGRCMWCNENFALHTSKSVSHECDEQSIASQETKWEQKTRQSKYFIPHTFSFHRIQYPRLMQSPTSQCQQAFKNLFAGEKKQQKKIT